MRRDKDTDMRRIFLSTAAALALVTAVQAQIAPGPATPGQATAGQVTPESVVSDLKAQGYSVVEVTVGPTQIKAEAVRDGMKREVIIDRATGSILKSEETSGAVSTVSGTEIKYRDRDFLNGTRGDDKANSEDDNSGDSSNDSSNDNSNDNSNDSSDDSGSDGNGWSGIGGSDD